MTVSFLQIVAILGSLTGSAYCLQVTIPFSAINVTVGQNATLYCTYSPVGTLSKGLFIQWSIFEAQSQQFKTYSPCFSSEENAMNHCKMQLGRDARGRCNWKHQVFYYQNGVSYSQGNFKNRVTAAISPGNATITISNMQPQETGFYSCEVLNPPDPISQGKIQLTVLAPPSTPHCSIQGPMETGHYLSLKCYAEVGMPRPQYNWNKVLDGLLKPTPPQMDVQSGMLIIGNMTNFDDGHYRCTANNSLGSSFCEIDLHTGGEGPIIAAGIIAAVLLAAIIIAVIWFLLVKKKKGKKQKMAASEMKSSSGSNTEYAAVPGEGIEPARENLVTSAPPETREYRDQAENEATVEMEDPAV
ncbi:V-set and immunoglobulin domain-containing protein 1 [Bombina bombina]|uniref:V-set and immunoglobulin domain-containing protein 1 n=1 Tax=Bombina bombina TaxID=8345 RepID=UPI00235AC1CA|nr:V-set and immunoglobulin domain-containing protein 1 [Bombina bombina]